MNPYRASSHKTTVILSGALLLNILLSAPSLVFAQAPAALNPPPSALAADRIGVVAAVKGKVEIKDARAVGRVVGSGALVYLGDTVSTDAEGQLQILLGDETIFTIGPDSSILIDKFIYDPATADGEVSAQILKGTFRFITGKIAKKKPENMAVKLPVGTIGVRGTMVAGRVDGVKSMAVLLGPGPQNQMGVPPGSFVLNNTVNDQIQSTHVTGINFGSEIAGVGVPPVPPFRVPDSVIESLCSQFGAPPAFAPGTPTGPPGSQMMGPPGSHTGPPPPAVVAFLQSLGFTLPSPGEFFDPSSLPTFDPRQFLPPPLQNLPPPPDEAARFEELRSLNHGPFHYARFDVATTNPNVKFNFVTNINFSDFPAGDVFGGAAGTGSKITSTMTDIGSFDFPLNSSCPTCNYGTDPSAFIGPAGFFYTNIGNAIPEGGPGCDGCKADVSVGIGNINGDVGPGAGIANLAVVGVLLAVTIKDGPDGNVLAQIAAPGIQAAREMGVADTNDSGDHPPPEGG